MSSVTQCTGRYTQHSANVTPAESAVLRLVLEVHRCQVNFHRIPQILLIRLPVFSRTRQGIGTRILSCHMKLNGAVFLKKEGDPGLLAYFFCSSGVADFVTVYGAMYSS